MEWQIKYDRMEKKIPNFITLIYKIRWYWSIEALNLEYEGTNKRKKTYIHLDTKQIIDNFKTDKQKKMISKFIICTIVNWLIKTDVNS